MRINLKWSILRNIYGARRKSGYSREEDSKCGGKEDGEQSTKESCLKKTEIGLEDRISRTRKVLRIADQR